MSDSENGGQTVPIVQTEHEFQPWEKRCHALGDVLECHSLINSAEKCRSIEALGQEMGDQLTYYERWIAVFTNIRFQNEGQRSI
ncbi:hypothetical protein [Pseudomonas sp. IT-P100]|uniref:hypothetical protein n=1 Tax=Pseudomonas sp. IT-P100 TaxID=3026452 RepID=UPI0039DF3508